ncbi:Uncharacterised protein [Candidatus Burarchaeum australiense]|nr:Uncharacterised protein [Candidatus Burarchaeum australiense]
MLVGVVCRRGEVEGILTSRVTVDGTDATDRIAEMVRSSRFAPQLRCVLLNSIMMGGFNVVNIRKLSDELGMPVIAITRKRPDRLAAGRAIKKHFADWKQRLAIVRRAGRARECGHKYKVYLQIAGTGLAQAEEIVEAYGLGPLRLANMIASGVTRGESHGRM